MRRIRMYTGVLILIVTVAFGLNVTTASASENTSLNATSVLAVSANNEEDKVETQATSRLIKSYQVYYSKIVPPSRYYYNDSLGYKGWLKRDYYTRDRFGNYTGYYSGTVTCQGTCPAPTNIPLDEK